MKTAILEILNSRTTDMGSDPWYGTEPGIPEHFYDEIAELKS